jgi:hypothetical protein
MEEKTRGGQGFVRHERPKAGPQQAAEKVIFSRLLKKGQMQGPQNPEEGGILGCTLQRRRMRET